MLSKFTNFLLLLLLIPITDHKPLTNHKSQRLPQSSFLSSSNAINKIFKTQDYKHTWKKPFSCSFTKAELQINQLKHKQLPPQIDFAILQNDTLKPVHYLIKHEKIYLFKNMTLTQFLLIMVQTNFPFVLTIKEMILLSNHYILSHLNLLLRFKQNSKHPLGRTTKLFTNNLFYSMTLILQAMTKIIYILEFQKMTLLFQQTQPYKTIILPLKNHHLKLSNKVPLQ